MNASTTEVTRLRLLMGLLQGVALYGLYQSQLHQLWPASDRQLFGPLLMLGIWWPLLGISGLGRMKGKAWVQWMLVAGALIAALGWYDLWRMNPMNTGWHDQKVQSPYPSLNAWVFLSAGLFMAHALVLSAAHDARRAASHATCFDIAWKLGIQFLFSALFVGALWLMLFLGASLFQLIGLSFLDHLLGKSWFNLPLSATALAWALHLTDVKPEIVRGIRGLLLVLLSWILPVVVVLAAGFLGSLPFTGLQPLWGTRHATAVLLCTAAALVVLVNTAFQNGERADAIHRAVRWSASLGAVLLLPLVALAVHALGLRVAQHGWSVDRVIAAACELVAAAYALGYAWAVISRPAVWLGPVAWVNVRVSWLILGVLVALFSPLLDPARIAVADQMARLRDGRIDAARLDYRYLRFESGRHGLQALQQLAKGQVGGPQGALAVAPAQLALKLEHKGISPPMAADLAMTPQGVRANIKAVWPAGATVPDSFVQTAWQVRRQGTEARIDLPTCLTKFETPCEAVMIQMDDDPALEVLILQRRPGNRVVLFDQGADASWRAVGDLPAPLVRCERHLQALREGRFETTPQPYRDLQLGGVRVPLRTTSIFGGPDIDTLNATCQ